MNSTLAFFIGLFFGWLAEWIIDFFFWRRRSSPSAQELALQADLDSAHADLSRAQTRCDAAEARLAEAQQAAETQAAALSQEVEALQAQVTEAQAEMKARAAQLAECQLKLAAVMATTPPAGQVEAEEPAGSMALSGEVSERTAEMVVDAGISLPDDTTAANQPTEPDDLKIVEGIGPKIAGILNDRGILTFAQLAETPASTLQAILDAAGSRYAMHDPTTWPQQAALAAAEDWDGLKQLQGTLKGGRP